MSLFSHEEICQNCIHSHWINGSWFWDNQPRFSRCYKDVESQVDSSRGECKTKKVITEPNPEKEK